MDSIYARDGARDFVQCGTGFDRATLDAFGVDFVYNEFWLNRRCEVREYPSY
jgi:hypothetical protein